MSIELLEDPLKNGSGSKDGSLFLGGEKPRWSVKLRLDRAVLNEESLSLLELGLLKCAFYLGGLFIYTPARLPVLSRNLVRTKTQRILSTV